MPARKKTKLPKRTKRPVSVGDLLSLRSVQGGALSADGSRYVFSVKSVRSDSKGTDTHLHVATFPDGDVRAYTFGKKSDGSPVLSADGRLAAFVSRRGRHPGIHILPLTGGEARPLVERDGSFASLSFSPDASTVLCTFQASDPTPNAGESEESSDENKPPKTEAPVYRHVDRLFYRLDGVGFLPKAEPDVWAYDVASGEGRRLTETHRSVADPVYSPDGKWIAFVANVQPDPDVAMWWTDLFVMPSKGGRARRIPTPPGTVSNPAFSPDGKTIAYLGHDDVEDPWFENTRVWTVPVSGKSRAKCLCPDFDQPAFDATITDTGESFGALTPVWSPDGKWIHFMSCSSGWSAIYRVRAKGGAPERLTPTKRHVMAASLSRDCRVAIGVAASATRPAEVTRFDLESGKATTVSSFNEKWASELDIQSPENVNVPSTEGTVVDAWILKPPSFSPKKKYPAIVEVHGGPLTQYGYSYFHEMQVLAAKGYVVYYSNPRGSLGYGRAFSEAIKFDWGKRDYADVSAGTDYLESLPYVNKKRIGITGGSYGGFMTNWAVGHTRRYKAAVTQRSVVDLVPFFGSSDVGYEFHHEFKGHPWQNREGYRRQSPLTYAEHIHTPLLIIHSENDMRCNIEQAENLFATLKVLGRTTEFVRFPEEFHGLSRTGRPDRRIVRLEKILDWFSRYL